MLHDRFLLFSPVRLLRNAHCNGDTCNQIVMPPVSSTTGFFVNGPIFLKSGVALRGDFNVEFSDWTDFWVYDGPNVSNTGEDAVIVIDNVTDVWVRFPILAGISARRVRAQNSLTYVVRVVQVAVLQGYLPRGWKSESQPNYLKSYCYSAKQFL